MIKREDFKKIIKLRSCWKIDKRIGNYKLPNNKKLSTYIKKLVETQMEIDNLAISKDGNLYFSSKPSWNEEKRDFDDYNIITKNETECCDWDRQEKRIDKLVTEIVGY